MASESAAAKPAAPRKRNRKRKRRAASFSSSSSESSSGSEPSHTKSPKITGPQIPLQESSHSSSSSSSESESESDSDSAGDTQLNTAIPPDQATTTPAKRITPRSHSPSPSPSPPPAPLPSFIPATNANATEDDATQHEQKMKEKFRKFWMASVADGFKDDLEQIRKEPNLSTSRLALLIDSLASGGDVFVSPSLRNDINEMQVVLE